MHFDSLPHGGLVSTRHAADTLGVSRAYVGRLIRQGHLAAVDVGIGTERPAYRIERTSLAAFIDARRSVR